MHSSDNKVKPETSPETATPPRRHEHRCKVTDDAGNGTDFGRPLADSWPANTDTETSPHRIIHHAKAQRRKEHPETLLATE
jgi:hypothetical protein